MGGKTWAGKGRYLGWSQITSIKCWVGFFFQGDFGLRISPPSLLCPSFLGVRPGQGVILFCSFSHSSSPGIPGHAGELQGSSWVVSPWQNVSLELGHSRERCCQPGSPPGTRQLWEQEDQDVQGVQPGISGRKDSIGLLYRGSGQAGKDCGEGRGSGLENQETFKGKSYSCDSLCS